MTNIENIIRDALGAIPKEDFGTPLEKLGIDSIDLVTLRVNLDSETGHEISDQHWLNIQTLGELVDYYQKKVSGAGAAGVAVHSEAGKKRYIINMPQMALGGLSENWLFKETGDFHWHSLCTGLNEKSSSIEDEVGNRLYATFVRIRWESNTHLRGFLENEAIDMSSEMTRFGKGMYFSDLQIASERGKAIHMKLMTTFSFREHSDNSKLAKGQPASKNISIKEMPALPDFGEEYRSFRKGEIREVVLQDIVFPVQDDSLWQMEYDIHPYIDLNGVNLLYFAAYPTISDYCEAKYFNREYVQAGELWADKAFTCARDIFYMANCNLTETIIFKLHYFEKISGNRVKISTSLSRKSDGKVLAHIFTIKTFVSV